MKHWRIYAIVAVFACLTIAGFNGAFKKKRPDYGDRLWKQAQSIDTKEAWDDYIFLRDNAHHTNVNIVSNRFFSLKPETMPATNHTGTLSMRYATGTITIPTLSISNRYLGITNLHYTTRYETNFPYLRVSDTNEGLIFTADRGNIYIGGRYPTNIVISNDWQGTIQVGTNYLPNPAVWFAQKRLSEEHMYRQARAITMTAAGAAYRLGANGIVPWESYSNDIYRAFLESEIAFPTTR